MGPGAMSLGQNQGGFFQQRSGMWIITWAYLALGPKGPLFTLFRMTPPPTHTPNQWSYPLCIYPLPSCFVTFMWVKADTLSIFQDKEQATNVIFVEKALLGQVVTGSRPRLSGIGRRHRMGGSPFREMSVTEETLKTRSSAEHLGAPLACQPCRPVGAWCSQVQVLASTSRA